MQYGKICCFSTIVHLWEVILLCDLGPMFFCAAEEIPEVGLDKL